MRSSREAEQVTGVSGVNEATKQRQSGESTGARGRVGNRVFARMLAGGGLTPTPVGVQPRLTIGAVGGSLEREADELATRVTGAGPPTAAVTAGASVPQGAVDPAIGAQIRGRSGHGQPLASELRTQLEPGLGADLGGVRVHTDTHAQALTGALQAHAFAHGSDVFFARGAYAPTRAQGRWLVAHELAHVIQQRGGAAANNAVQCYFILKQAQHAGTRVTKHDDTRFVGHEKDDEHRDYLANDTKAINRVSLVDIPDMAISDDGKLAVEDLEAGGGNREAESFFAEPAVVTAANKKLGKAYSSFQLLATRANALKVPDLTTDTLHNLSLVVPQAVTYDKGTFWDDTNRGVSGSEVTGKEQCNEMAQEILGVKQDNVKLQGQNGVNFRLRDHDMGMTIYLEAYIKARVAGQAEGPSLAAAKLALNTYVVPNLDHLNTNWNAQQVEIITADKPAMTRFVGALGQLNLAEVLNKRPQIFDASGGMAAATALEDGRWRLVITVADRSHVDDYQETLDKPALRDNIAAQNLLATTGRVQQYTPAQANAHLAELRTNILLYMSLHPEHVTEVNRRLHMNEWATPDVSEGYKIFHKGDGGDSEFPYHYAGVVAKSGLDTITYENYAREVKSPNGSDQRMFFQIYGPKRVVTVNGTRVRRGLNPNEDAELAAGSFHGRWKGIFEAAQTVTVGR